MANRCERDDRKHNGHACARTAHALAAMNGARSLESLSPLALTADDERNGRIATLQAAAGTACGPVINGNVPSGHFAGPCAHLVGQEALAFAYGAGREFLSSFAGWRPLLGRRFGAAVLNSDEPAHRVERQAWAPAFASAALARSVAGMDRVIARRVRRWIAVTTIDAYEAARELAFAIAATQGAGFRDDAATAELGRQFGEVLHGPREDEDIRNQHERVKPLRDAIERAVCEHIRRSRNEDRRDEPSLPALLLRKHPSLSDEELLAHINVLLVAGHETTASLLGSALLLIAKDPAWRERLAREAASLPAKTDAAALGRLSAFDAFVAETGRLYPPLVNAPRLALRGFDLSGIRVSARTTVAIAIGATNRLGYADSEVFRPERWLRAPDEGGAQAAALFTFGHGQRRCLGMRFAQLAVKLALCRVLQAAVPTGDATRWHHAGFWNARPRGVLSVRMVSIM
jgi:cytochrome P450